MARVAKEKGLKVVARNRKAYYEYLIEDTFEAGMVLSGTEVKSLRAGRASLVDGYATVRDGEVWLEGVHIPEYTEATWNNHMPRRRRKLLLNKAQIAKLIQKTKESGHTIVPLSMYFKDGYAKVEIALAKGKRTYDKRQTLRAKQDEREAQRAISARREK